MPRHSISPGLYVDAQGVYWSRLFVRGRRTWRKLRAIKQRAALLEHATRDFTTAGTFADLGQLYLDAGCPNRKHEATRKDIVGERARVAHLIQYFRTMPANSIRMVDIPKYKAWRLRHITRGTGLRAVDKEIQTLSNVFNYGVALGQLDFNYIRSARPRYCTAALVRHARQVAPPDASAIHRLADHFLGTVRSEVLGWQLLFAMFTGCRTSELLRLRLDAPSPDVAGFYSDGHLFLARSKGGVNPWAIVGPEFAQMLDCFHRWHAARFPKVPWYFPSPDKPGQCLSPGALGHGLTRACPLLDLPHITPHGLRSYYVTKRRSDGAADTVIAGELGDQTVSLMQTTYGARPANWTGGAALSWLPADGLPAWQLWQDAAQKIVSL